MIATRIFPLLTRTRSELEHDQPREITPPRSTLKYHQTLPGLRIRTRIQAGRMEGGGGSGYQGSGFSQTPVKENRSDSVWGW